MVLNGDTTATAITSTSTTTTTTYSSTTPNHHCSIRITSSCSQQRRRLLAPNHNNKERICSWSQRCSWCVYKRQPRQYYYCSTQQRGDPPQSPPTKNRSCIHCSLSLVAFTVSSQRQTQNHFPRVDQLRRIDNDQRTQTTRTRRQQQQRFLTYRRIPQLQKLLLVFVVVVGVVLLQQQSSIVVTAFHIIRPHAVRWIVPVAGPTTTDIATTGARHRRTTTSSSSRSSSTTTAIMGIKGFRSWFESQFPHAIVSLNKDSMIQSNETFDHVLIDMNQILHVVLRKSRSIGHCFTLLMVELDQCVAMAQPTQSLVLAMDGSPGAAKLATQRRRRYQVVRKTNIKVAKLDLQLSSIRTRNNTTTMSRRAKKSLKQWTRQKRKALADTQTLCITPGTDFMAQAEQVLLYWAWQRLSSRQTPLSLNNVKVFVSSSLVPGEGEVKLLEWIYTKPHRHGESIAILGGDSDLVLEALVIPIASTHNVFVLLPDGNQRCLSISLWETTRTLLQYLPHYKTPQEIIHLRTDLVLLLILNGNDYLPKLRGSSGFNKLFHSYLRVQREWYKRQQQQQKSAATTTLDAADTMNTSPPPLQSFLVNPDTLQFNLEFAAAFFRRLMAMAPSSLLYDVDTGSPANSRGETPLHQLSIFVDRGLLPRPMKFSVLEDDDDDESNNKKAAVEIPVDEDVDCMVSSVEEEEDDGDVDDDDDGEDGESAEGDPDQIRLRLELGEPGSEDYYIYEVRHKRRSAMKASKHKLAAMALSDFMDDIEGNGGDDEDDSTVVDDGNEDDADDDGTPRCHEWEVQKAAEGNVERYLYGLLWNLQTYQDGVCADYGYNYGRRMSPLARDITTFFDEAILANRTVGPADLRPPPHFTPPVSAGISSLAALPSAAKHLVPKPYRHLPDETVDQFYASCMDPVDNVLDLKRFESLCEEKLENMELPDTEHHANTVKIEQQTKKPQQKALAPSDCHWAVMYKVPKPLSQPFDPPEPFSDRHSKLKANNRIRIGRYLAAATPRSRVLPKPTEGSDSSEHNEDEDIQLDSALKAETEAVRQSDPGAFMRRFSSIEQVDYRTAFQKSRERKGIRRQVVTLVVKKNPGTTKTTSTDNGHKNHIQKPDLNVAAPEAEATLKRKGMEASFPQSVKNLDGETAMAVLKQLSDLKLVGEIKWNTVECDRASLNPNVELVQLSVMCGGKTITHDLDRDVNDVGRKVIQQHLASLVLCDITGPDVHWSKLTYKDLKKHLTQSDVKH